MMDPYAFISIMYLVLILRYIVTYFVSIESQFLIKMGELPLLHTVYIKFFSQFINVDLFGDLCLLHFVAFFHVASLFSTGVHNKKVRVHNEKALELTNSTVFHRGRQQKCSRAGQQNIFFIFQPDFNEEISPKNATKHPVA